MKSSNIALRYRDWDWDWEDYISDISAIEQENTYIFIRLKGYILWDLYVILYSSMWYNKSLSWMVTQYLHHISNNILPMRDEYDNLLRACTQGQPSHLLNSQAWNLPSYKFDSFLNNKIILLISYGILFITDKAANLLSASAQGYIFQV